MRVVGQQGGVAALGDYASGYSLDGADNSQNGCAIDGVPVHFPYHFGGIFSIFSPWQYPKLSLNKSIRKSGSMPVVGGEIDLYGHRNHPERMSGTVNAGITASSLGLEAPLSQTLSMSASARISYIDAIFHDLISSDDSDLRYSFYDADLSITQQLPGEGTLRAFGHYNGDHLCYGDLNFSLNTRLHWHNALGGITWQRDDADASLYVTEMGNTLSLEMESMKMNIPSGILQAGAKGSKRWSVSNVNLETGISADYYRIRPQGVSSSGLGTDNVSQVRHDNSCMARIWGNAEVPLTRLIVLEAGLEVNAYFAEGGYHRIDPDPRLTLRFNIGDGDLSLHAGRYHQYIHTVGMSEIGMPSNFKLAASQSCGPEQLLGTAASWRSPLPWLGLRLHADLYYRKVFSQPEYTGGVLNLLDNGYNPENYIIDCRGYNYGGSVTLTRDFVALSASLTYSFGIARRRSKGTDSWFRASSEPGHRFDANVAYSFPGDHWMINATFACHSGRPVTPLKSAYIIGQYVVIEYGKRNSSRLPSYQRLDVGASYSFSTRFHASRHMKHTVSISLINAYGHRNAEISKYTLNKKTLQIRKKYVYSLYRFLPSLSYTIDF